MSEYPPGKLLQSRCLDDWKAAEEGYESALEAVARRRKAWPLLRELDEKRRKFGESGENLCRESLKQIVKWKITRGKFRPLMKMVEGNSEDAIADAWKAAVDEIAQGRLVEAVVALTALRGVGVATASAVLSSRDPRIPFMSDEAILACDVPRKYDLPTYKAVFERITRTASELRTLDDTGADWTAEMVKSDNHIERPSRQVQQCLWASNNIPKETAVDSETGKRKRDS